MIIDLFLILLPMIVVTLGGYLFALFFAISEETLVRAVTDFFMPLLVFFSLSTSDIYLKDTVKLAGAVTFVLLLLLAASYLYCRFSGQEFRAVTPPIIFMNSGFLGIPLMQLWGGLSAMNLIVIYDQIQTFYIFTIGIILVTGGLTFRGLFEMIKSPLLWAIILGFLFKYGGIVLPEAVLRVFQFGGSGAPSLAAFALGCSLRKRKIKAGPYLAAGLLLRFGFGFLAGLLAVHLFQITGLARTVVLVASSLPSAVFSVVLPLRYSVDARYAGSMIITSSLLGVLVIPFIFYLSSLV